MRITRIQLLIVSIVFLFAGKVNASVVQFDDIDDSHSDWGFYVDGTQPNGNILEIDVYGSLPASAPFSLQASNAAPVNSMFDTISFNVSAPDGYYIRGIIYQESLRTTVSLNGGNAWTIADGSISVNGDARTLGSAFFGTDVVDRPFGLDENYDLSGQRVTTAAISITNSILAGATGGGTAFIAKGYDENGMLKPTLEVILEPIPIPAAVWLFGSALVGFAAYSRSKRI